MIEFLEWFHQGGNWLEVLLIVFIVVGAIGYIIDKIRGKRW